MRHLLWLPGGCVLALGLVGGCEPANRYHAGPSSPERTIARLPAPAASLPTPPVPPTPPPSLNPGLAWIYPTASQIEPSARLEFVQADDHPESWTKLKNFWNAPAVNPAAIGLSPLPAVTTAAVQQANQVIQIKVPLGLDDPTPYIPAANPPNAAKWALGKKLFYDDSWLLLEGKVACANCHDPQHGFTDPHFGGASAGSIDTPTLVNTAYNHALFWDGRAGALEEVVQRSLEDERPTSLQTADRRHVWGGVVERLRKSPTYRDAFAKTFGTQPTSDATGKALATYLRTLLCGTSVHDQAVRAARERKALTPNAADYQQFLTDDLLKAWESDGASNSKTEAAKQLATGFQVFTGKGRCVHCHNGANFTDSGFHNVGIGDSAVSPPPGEESGRFTALAIGLKDPNMIGAYKTPTLRGLARKSRYFHDGLHNNLFGAVLHHIQGHFMNPYLDPELRDPADPSRQRNLSLSEEEKVALILFLRSLEGDPVPVVVRDPQQQPAGIPSDK